MHAISPAPVTKTYGRLTVTAQITVDGGYSINVMTGPIREDALCLATTDRDLYRRVYAIIGEGGNNGVSPDGINAAIRDELTRDLHTAQRRRNNQQADLINDVLDQLDTPAQAAADQRMLDGIADNIERAPRTLADVLPEGTRRQVPPTMAGAHLAPVSQPLARICATAAAGGGTIARSRDANARQLSALARRGLATLNYQSGRGRRQVIASATLTKLGYAAAKAVA